MVFKIRYLFLLFVIVFVISTFPHESYAVAGKYPSPKITILYCKDGCSENFPYSIEKGDEFKLRVKLENCGDDEATSPEGWEIGIHIRLENAEFTGYDLRQFNWIYPFDKNKNKIDINGARIVEVSPDSIGKGCSSKFTDLMVRVTGSSGDVKIRYRDWIKDNDDYGIFKDPSDSRDCGEYWLSCNTYLKEITIVSVTTTSTTTSTSTISTTTSTTTSIEPCKLDSVSINPYNCGENSCNQGNSIRIAVTYSGSCPSISYIQVDAKSDDGLCNIQSENGDILGIQIECDSSPCVEYWYIPSVPSSCCGKNVTAYASGIYENNWPPNGNGLDWSEASGGFTFGDCTTTTTTSSTTSTTFTTTTTIPTVFAYMIDENKHIVAGPSEVKPVESVNSKIDSIIITYFSKEDKKFVLNPSNDDLSLKYGNKKYWYVFTPKIITINNKQYLITPSIFFDKEGNVLKDRNKIRSLLLLKNTYHLTDGPSILTIKDIYEPIVNKPNSFITPSIITPLKAKNYIDITYGPYYQELRNAIQDGQIIGSVSQVNEELVKKIAVSYASSAITGLPYDPSLIDYVFEIFGGIEAGYSIYKIWNPEIEGDEIEAYMKSFHLNQEIGEKIMEVKSMTQDYFSGKDYLQLYAETGDLQYYDEYSNKVRSFTKVGVNEILDHSLDVVANNKDNYQLVFDYVYGTTRLSFDLKGLLNISEKVINEEADDLDIDNFILLNLDYLEAKKQTLMSLKNDYSIVKKGIFGTLFDKWFNNASQIEKIDEAINQEVANQEAFENEVKILNAVIFAESDYFSLWSECPYECCSENDEFIEKPCSDNMICKNNNCVYITTTSSTTTSSTSSTTIITSTTPPTTIPPTTSILTTSIITTTTMTTSSTTTSTTLNGIQPVTSNNFYVYTDSTVSNKVSQNYLNIISNTAENALESYINLGYRKPLNTQNNKRINILVTDQIVTPDFPGATELAFFCASLNNLGCIIGIQTTCEVDKIRIYYDIKDIEELKITVAHELGHAVHRAYDVCEDSPLNSRVLATPSIAEGTNQWLAHYVYPFNESYWYSLPNGYNVLIQNIQKNLFKTGVSTFISDNTEKLITYSSVLFWNYLSEKHSNDIILELWNNLAADTGKLNGIDGLKHTLSQYSTDLNQTYLDFGEYVYKNYKNELDENFKIGKYRITNSGSIELCQSGLDCVLLSPTIITGVIESYGTLYYKFDNSDGFTGIINFTISKLDTNKVFVLRFYEVGLNGELILIDSKTLNQNDKTSIQISTSNRQKILVIVSRLENLNGTLSDDSINTFKMDVITIPPLTTTTTSYTTTTTITTSTISPSTTIITTTTAPTTTTIIPSGNGYYATHYQNVRANSDIGSQISSPGGNCKATINSFDSNSVNLSFSDGSSNTFHSKEFKSFSSDDCFVHVNTVGESGGDSDHVLSMYIGELSSSIGIDPSYVEVSPSNNGRFDVSFPLDYDGPSFLTDIPSSLYVSESSQNKKVIYVDVVDPYVSQMSLQIVFGYDSPNGTLGYLFAPMIYVYPQQITTTTTTTVTTTTSITTTSTTSTTSSATTVTTTTTQPTTTVTTSTTTTMETTTTLSSMTKTPTTIITTTSISEPLPVCRDGVCEEEENETTCSEDCSLDYRKIEFEYGTIGNHTYNNYPLVEVRSNASNDKVVTFATGDPSEEVTVTTSLAPGNYSVFMSYETCWDSEPMSLRINNETEIVITLNETTLNDCSRRKEYLGNYTVNEDSQFNITLRSLEGDRCSNFPLTMCWFYADYIEFVKLSSGEITIAGVEHISFEKINMTEYKPILIDSTNKTNTSLEIVTKINITDASINITGYLNNPTTVNFSLLELGKYVEINVDPRISQNLSWAIIRIHYTDEEISKRDINESTLRIYYYNGSDWNPYNHPYGGVNTSENFVWANTTHFSLYGVFGSSNETQTTTTVTTTTILKQATNTPSNEGEDGWGGSVEPTPTSTTVPHTSTTSTQPTTTTTIKIPTTTTTIKTVTTSQEEVGLPTGQIIRLGKFTTITNVLIILIVLIIIGFIVFLRSRFSRNSVFYRPTAGLR